MSRRIAALEKSIDALKEEIQTLLDQAGRHRSHGESDATIKRQLSRARGDLYHARRELLFASRPALI